MPKFNWIGETGITESAWLQGIAAIVAGVAAANGYTEIALQAGIASQFILAGITWILRRFDKKMNERSKDNHIQVIRGQAKELRDLRNDDNA